MPARRSSIARQKASLRAKKYTTIKDEFVKMRVWFPDRLNILAVGDSWFAYPPPSLIFGGPPSNLIDHLSTWTRYKANFYSMSKNGAEAVELVSGKQKHDMIEVLRWHTKARNRKPVDLLIFSGGGNDIVGENDFERFLRAQPTGSSASHWVHLARLRRKTKQIGLTYEELIDIRDHFSPETVILTHTYDYPYSSLTGARFLGGLIKTKAWMKRFMDEINIPENLQCEVIRIFMDEMASVTQPISNRRENFHVANTIGTLVDRNDWRDEIHPTSEGFKSLASALWQKVVQVYPQLLS